MAVTSLVVRGQEKLSLSDAINIGLGNNYGILIEEKNIAVAENNNTWGEAGRLPTINLNVQSQNSRRNQTSDNQFFGGQLFPGFELNNQQSYSMTPGATVTWNIFQGNAAIINKRRLEQLQAQSSQNAQVVMANTIQTIILGYYLAVLEVRRLREFRKQLDLSKDRYVYQKVKYDLGSSITSDLLLEENNLLTDSANYINQQLELQNAFRGLNTVLAVEDINRQYLLTDTLIRDDFDFTYGDLEQAAFESNVDLKQIYISQRLLHTNTRLQSAQRLPTLSLNGGYNWTRNVSDLTNATYSGPNPDYQNPPDPLVSKTGTYFANFTLSFNLYDGNRINRAINNAVIEEDIGNLRIDQLKQTIRRDLASAYDQYLTRRHIATINRRRKEAAAINLRNSEEKYKNGTINSIDFRVVQNNYLSAAIQELQAIFNLIDSKVTIMRLTGGLISEYDTE